MRYMDRDGHSPADAGEEVSSWVGIEEVVDAYGVAVGSLEGIWIETDPRERSWLVVKRGPFGSRGHTMVPATHALASAGRITVLFARPQVMAAPEVMPERAHFPDWLEDAMRALGVADGDAAKPLDAPADP